MLTVALVHGLWHGAWSWDGVRRLLDDAGVPSAAVELPMTGLADDVATTRRVLDGVTGPVLLVGHSYGGAVVTEAGLHPAVRHLAYVAAMQLAEGESISRVLPELEIPPTRLAEALRFSPDGSTIDLDPVRGPDLVYGPDADPALVAGALPRLRPVARRVFRDVPGAAAWRQRPSDHVVCTEDRTVHPDLQRAMAARGSARRHEWACGHSPQLTEPGRVAAFLRGLAG